MAQYATLKAAINAVIRANGNKEITGTVLNETLTAIVNSLGANYQFAGVATPSTNPGTPDQNVFYLAGQAGTYTNFNNIVLPDGVSVLKWNGSWSSDTVVAGDGVFDISAYKATGGTLATFADLSAALDGGNNIPSALRKGGMSVKFVQRSDNKYVQYRLKMSNPTTAQFVNTANWQGIEDVPTAGSDNLVNSGGIARNRYIFSDKTPNFSTLNLTTWAGNATITNVSTNVMGITENLRKVDFNMLDTSNNTLGFDFRYNEQIHEGDIINLVACIYTEDTTERRYFMSVSTNYPTDYFTFDRPIIWDIKSGFNYFYFSMRSNITFIPTENQFFQLRIKDSTLDGKTWYIKAYKYIGTPHQNIFFKVDNEPTVGSDSLVKSGGVMSGIYDLYKAIPYDKINIKISNVDRYIKYNYNWASNIQGISVCYIPVIENDTLSLEINNSSIAGWSEKYFPWIFTNSTGEISSSKVVIGAGEKAVPVNEDYHTKVILNVPNGAKYLAICTTYSGSYNAIVPDTDAKMLSKEFVGSGAITDFVTKYNGITKQSYNNGMFKLFRYSNPEDILYVRKLTSSVLTLGRIVNGSTEMYADISYTPGQPTRFISRYMNLVEFIINDISLTYDSGSVTDYDAALERVISPDYYQPSQKFISSNQLVNLLIDELYIDGNVVGNLYLRGIDFVVGRITIGIDNPPASPAPFITFPISQKSSFTTGEGITTSGIKASIVLSDMLMSGGFDGCNSKNGVDSSLAPIIKANVQNPRNNPVAVSALITPPFTDFSDNMAGVEDMCRFINSCELTKQIKDSLLTSADEFEGKYDNNICFDGLHIFVAASAGDIEGGASDVKLYIVDRTTGATTSLVIAENNKSVTIGGSSYTMQRGGSMPNCALTNDGLRIVFCTMISDKFVLMSCLVNTSTLSVTSYDFCQLGTDNFDQDAIVAAGGIYQDSGAYSINMNANFAAAKDSNGYYYCGVTGSRKLKYPLIVKTLDLVNFEFVMFINRPLMNAAFECTTALNVESGVTYLYSVTRQAFKSPDGSLFLIADKCILSTGMVEWTYYIKGADSRPCLFKRHYGDILLAYNLPNGRNRCRIVDLSTNSERKIISEITIQQFGYPSFVAYNRDNGTYIVSAGIVNGYSNGCDIRIAQIEKYSLADAMSISSKLDEASKKSALDPMYSYEDNMTGTEMMRRMLNSRLFEKQMVDNVICKFEEASDCSSCYNGNYFYTVGVEGTNNDVFWGTGSKTVLYINNRSDGSLVSRTVIAEENKQVTIDGASVTMQRGASMPNIAITSNGLCVMFCTMVNNVFVLMRCLVDLSDNTIVSYTICTLDGSQLNTSTIRNLGGIYVDMTKEYSININGNFQDAKDDNGYWYVGVTGAYALKYPMIMKTNDFASFTFVTFVTADGMNSSYECTTGFIKQNSLIDDTANTPYLYTATRQMSLSKGGNKFIMVNAINLNTNQVEQTRMVKGNDSRPCIFAHRNGQLILAYSLGDIRNRVRMVWLTDFSSQSVIQDATFYGCGYFNFFRDTTAPWYYCVTDLINPNLTHSRYLTKCQINEYTLNHARNVIDNLMNL